MDERSKAALAFMNKPPDGKYEPAKPSYEQLTEILPWLVDQTVRAAREFGHCRETNEVLAEVLSSVLPMENDSDPKFTDSDGFDVEGYNAKGFDAAGYNVAGLNAEGYGADGFDGDGYDREGFGYDGRDRDGFNREGRNRLHQTREEAAIATVQTWSRTNVEVLLERLKERTAAAAAAARTP